MHLYNVNLYLIHWPAMKKLLRKPLLIGSIINIIQGNLRTTKTKEAGDLESARRDEETRLVMHFVQNFTKILRCRQMYGAIGVSNYTLDHMKELVNTLSDASSRIK